MTSRLLHRTMTGTPPLAVRGEGSWLHLSDGRRILDASGGAAVSCLGHGHPDVVAAVQRQVATLDYAHTGFFTNEPAEALADKLVGHASVANERGGLTTAYFVSGGSEAMEAALKLARQHFVERGEPGRTRFIARRQSYHGNTLGALAAGGNAARRAPYAPLLADAFSHVAPAFAYRDRRDDEDEPAHVARLAGELEAEFRRLGPHSVAAFVAETVVGATAGAVAPPAGYLRAVRDVCDRHGALLILDEVMCGMGRCGTLHAWEAEGASPDIQAIAKGLGGGVQPIGAILMNDRVLAPIRGGSGAFQHGHTYLAHPVACAAALAVQTVIEREGLLDRVNALGARLEDSLTERFGNHRHVGDIRGRGLFRALEFVEDRATKRPFDPARRLNLAIRDRALALGLAVYPGAGTADGRSGDHILLAPPYTATEAEVDLIADRLGTAVEGALAA